MISKGTSSATLVLETSSFRELLDRMWSGVNDSSDICLLCVFEQQLLLRFDVASTVKSAGMPSSGQDGLNYDKSSVPLVNAFFFFTSTLRLRRVRSDNKLDLASKIQGGV